MNLPTDSLATQAAQPSESIKHLIKRFIGYSNKACFTNDYLPAIQMRWKSRLVVIPLLAIRSQQIFAHATTAQLSCHLQNFVAITVLKLRWEWNEISIEFDGKLVYKTGPRMSYWGASPYSHHVNTLRPRPNRDDIFKCIFLNENVWISIKISLKFVPKGPINNIPALVQIMAWRRWGDKPLSEPMMVSLPTHICVTRLQWVNHFLWSVVIGSPFQ